MTLGTAMSSKALALFLFSFISLFLFLFLASRTLISSLDLRIKAGNIISQASEKCAIWCLLPRSRC